MAETQFKMVFDWMEFTVFDVCVDKVVDTLFKVSSQKLLHTQSGRFGYNNTVTYGEKILVMWNDKRIEMGVHVFLSGTACRELETIMTWKIFISRVLEFDAVRYSRVDVAIDCHKECYTIQQIREHVKSGQVVSKFRKATYMEQLSIGNGENESASIKFGSMSSDMYIVFYDKLAERKNAGYAVDPNLKCWNRCELRFKHDLAVKLMSLYILNDMELGSFVCEVLYNYIDFKQSTGKSRVTNEDTCQWWLDFLGIVKKLRIAPKSNETTLVQKQAYLETHSSRLFAMVSAVSTDLRLNMVDNGIAKIKETDMQIINSYLVSIGECPIKYENLKDVIENNIRKEQLYHAQQLRMQGV